VIVSWYQYIPAASYDAGAPVLPGAWTLRPLEFKILVVKMLAKARFINRISRYLLKFTAAKSMQT
jgi:hypothetical protein